MKILELKVPPPLVMLSVAGAMWAVAPSGPALGLPEDLRTWLASGIALLGVTIDITSLLSFRRAKTTINPMKPRATSTLVTTGTYRYSRNPMYVGLLSFLLAWAAYLGSAWTLAGPVLFVLYMNRFQIAPEEKVLAKMFGTTYSEYCERVRRWL